MLLFKIDFNAVTTMILEALPRLRSIRKVLSIKYTIGNLPFFRQQETIYIFSKRVSGVTVLYCSSVNLHSEIH